MIKIFKNESSCSRNFIHFIHSISVKECIKNLLYVENNFLLVMIYQEGKDFDYPILEEKGEISLKNLFEQKFEEIL